MFKLILFSETCSPHKFSQIRLQKISSSLKFNFIKKSEQSRHYENKSSKVSNVDISKIDRIDHQSRVKHNNCKNRQLRNISIRRGDNKQVPNTVWIVWKSKIN